MPDNLSPDLVAYALLEDRQLVSLSGPDAVTFAQAQFSSDVAALSDSHWHWSAWLTAKGRTIAVFQLIRLSSDALLLVLADGDADAIASQLQRFVFRRKVKITRREDLQVRAAFAAPQAAVGATVAGSLEEMLELDLGGTSLLRVMCITPTEADLKTADADAALTAAWRQADLRLGLPRLVPNQREHWTPQQLGLDRLNGYSVRKGCYPGQEIVARTHFLGKAKRALQLLQLSAPAEPGASVEQDGSVLGSIASVADGLALAVLPLETSDGALSVGGAPAQRLPLHDGLAR
ncbi:CAF17-like 4Fe-4S cluster assembly/insertion protein YgfZ [Stenotrophomonas lacuserhaii]|uniref:CAF17-like 4Fe-4S cluster assembly/insertion protein YgfZ n=1 Tax=Stenotrophomonas lacuserhaii TaxID=2760084 RepID=UPI00296B46E0|nr:folate-binding protein [Stenotrophomonas pennii]